MNGQISAQRIDESYQRIKRLKRKFDLSKTTYYEAQFKKAQLKQRLTAMQLEAAQEEIKILKESGGKKKKKKKSKE
jgi:beta-glucosidase-like glycosyl hydrolase